MRLIFKKQYKTVVKNSLPHLAKWGSDEDQIANFVENKMKAFVEILKSYLADDKFDTDFRVIFVWLKKFRTSVGRLAWSSVR